MLDEIHGNGIPGSFWHRKLLHKAVGFMPWGFAAFASRARIAEMLYKGSEIRPHIIASY